MFFRKRKKIDIYIDEVTQEKDIALIDVRSKGEFDSGSIVSSKNIPLETISEIDLNKNQKIYVYCYSGSRSAMALRQLKRMGYTDVTNIGGIKDYTKELQRRT